MKEPMKTVAFRVPKPIWRALEAKANELRVSPHVYARIRVTEPNEQSFIIEKLCQIEERQLQYERLLKRAIVAILVDAGKASVEEAEAFVRESTP